MKFLKDIGDILGKSVEAIGKIFGGSSQKSSSESSVTTLYEPDRVRIAELEDKKLDKLIKAQRDIVKMNDDMQEARLKAQGDMAKTLKELMYEVNIIAQQRLELLENGHFDIVERIEKMYYTLEKEINEDSIKFNKFVLPDLLRELEKFEKETPSYTLYLKSIESEMLSNIEFVKNKLKAVGERQKMLIESSIQTKERLLEHTSKIVEDRMKFFEMEIVKHKEESFIKSDNPHLLIENKPL